MMRRRDPLGWAVALNEAPGSIIGLAMCSRSAAERPFSVHRAAGLILALLLAALPRPTLAQVVTLQNPQGANAPCVGLGPVGEFCAKQLEGQGFVRSSQVGETGVTIGAVGDQDGVVLSVANSAKDPRGLQVGDRILAIDGKAVRLDPGGWAAQRLFGRRGEKVLLEVAREGSARSVTLVRAPFAATPGPSSPTILVAFRDLVDWKGRYIPCMGAGPAGFLAINYCVGHFRAFGYAPVDVAGDIGVTFDFGAEDAARIKAVSPQSPAGSEGLAPGDVVSAIDREPVKPTRADSIHQALFGKIGEARKVTVLRSGKVVQLTVLLVAKN